MILQRYPAKHLTIDGRRNYVTPENDLYPGVTTVLGGSKPKAFTQALADWSESMGADRSQRYTQLAISRGVWIHQLIESYLEDGTDLSEMMPDHINPYWMAVKPFLATVGTSSLIEGAVWSCKGYGGTVDHIGYDDRGYGLRDWKTAKKVKEPDRLYDHYLQIAAYIKATEERYGIEVSFGEVVIICPWYTHVLSVSREEVEGYHQEFLERLSQYQRSLAVA